MTASDRERVSADASAPAASVAPAFERLVEQLRAACADPHVAARLAVHDTVLRLQVAGEPDLACTLHVTESPRVGDGGDYAEGEITLAPQDVDGFWETPVAARILRGDARYRGDVRVALAMLPIIRAHARGKLT